MLLTSFNSADVIWMEIGFFGEEFLAQMESFSQFWGGGAKNDTIISCRHSLKRKQSLPRISTPLNG
jgi:hypothetical protein